MAEQTDDVFDMLDERITEWAEEIEKRNSHCRRYRLFHLLIGSTPDKPGGGTVESIDCFDFPGEDSVVLFVERILLPMMQS
jgi:hypothetical protein